jgi:hypothetical protein
MVDDRKFQNLIKDLYATVNELERMFPGRHFTPDGHMVGSIGECIVVDAYDLELMPASNKGYDAVTKSGKKIEIKATQSDSAAFRSEPEHTIVIKINPDGSFDEIYNGPGSIVWSQFKGKPLPSNGQYQISLNKLKDINLQVTDNQRVPKIA